MDVDMNDQVRPPSFLLATNVHVTVGPLLPPLVDLHAVPMARTFQSDIQSPREMQIFRAAATRSSFTFWQQQRRWAAFQTPPWWLTRVVPATSLSHSSQQEPLKPVAGAHAVHALQSQKGQGCKLGPYGQHDECKKLTIIEADVQSRTR